MCLLFRVLCGLGCHICIDSCVCLETATGDRDIQFQNATPQMAEEIFKRFFAKHDMYKGEAGASLLDRHAFIFSSHFVSTSWCTSVEGVHAVCVSWYSSNVSPHLCAAMTHYSMAQIQVCHCCFPQLVCLFLSNHYALCVCVLLVPSGLFVNLCACTRCSSGGHEFCARVCCCGAVTVAAN